MEIEQLFRDCQEYWRPPPERSIVDWASEFATIPGGHASPVPARGAITLAFSKHHHTAPTLKHLPLLGQRNTLTRGVEETRD